MRPLLTIWLTFSLAHVLCVRAQISTLTYTGVGSSALNPAHVSLPGESSMRLLYKRETPDHLVSFNSFSLHGILPLVNKNKNHWGGLGMEWTDDRNDFNGFNTTGASLSFSAGLPLTPHLSLLFGVSQKALYSRIRTDRFTTGSQWIDNQGFVPEAPLGELFNRQSTLDFYSTTGVLLLHKMGNDVLYELGVNISDYVPKNWQFISDRRERAFYGTLHGAVRAYEHPAFQVYPEFYLQKGPAYRQLNLGIRGRLPLGHQGPYQNIQQGTLDVLLKHTLDKMLFTGLQLHQPGFTIGISYGFPSPFARTDLPLHMVEVAVSFKKTRPHQPENSRNSMPLEQARAFQLTNSDSTGKAEKTHPEIQYVQIEKLSENSLDSVSYIQWVGFHHPFKFGFNKSTLDDQDIPYLDSLAAILQIKSALKLIIIGHTDNIGTIRVNYKISQKRALAVYEFLISKSISPTRMIPVGKGAEDPVEENTTEEKRALNRRVEFIFYK